MNEWNITTNMGCMDMCIYATIWITYVVSDSYEMIAIVKLLLSFFIKGRVEREVIIFGRKWDKSNERD